MDIEIINDPFTIELYGFSGVPVNYNFGETGFRLMNGMWQAVKSNNLKPHRVRYWPTVGRAPFRLTTFILMANLPMLCPLKKTSHTRS